MPRSFAGGLRGRPGANLFNVPRVPEKDLKDDTDAMMGVDNIDELQAWVDGLLKEDREEEPPSFPTTSSDAAPAAAADAQQGTKASSQGAAVPSLPSPSVLETAWGAARAAQPVDGIPPPCSLSGPGASVADGMATSAGADGHFAALRLSATDGPLKILGVPTGSYFAYPGRALEGYSLFAIVPPAQHAHLNHQLQVLLRMDQILRISGLGVDTDTHPVEHRVLHHVIVPSRHLGQPPVAIAMESLLTLIRAADEQASTIFCQSRSCAE
jgi:hypothetical protein